MPSSKFNNCSKPQTWTTAGLLAVFHSAPSLILTRWCASLRQGRNAPWGLPKTHGEAGEEVENWRHGWSQQRVNHWYIKAAWTFSGVSLSHMSNIAAHCSFRRVHNNTESSGAFRWGVEQQAEAGCSTLSPLQRSPDFVYSTSTSALITKSFLDISVGVFCVSGTSCYLYSFRFFFILHLWRVRNTPTHSWWTLWRISCCVLTSALSDILQTSYSEALTWTFLFTHDDLLSASLKV